MKVKNESEVAQSCPTLSHPMDCSLPGSPVHGIFQARVLEWGAIAFSSRIAQGAQIQYSDNLGGGIGREVGGRFRREGTYVFLQLIHVNVWQKPTQHCKAIILQLKYKLKKKSLQVNKNMSSKSKEETICSVSVDPMYSQNPPPS